jgi:hypothetical protein
MKKITQILLLFTLIIFSSCAKEESILQNLLERETIIAKWIYDEGNVSYSIEFNESGNYILFIFNHNTNNSLYSDVIFGTFKIIDNNTIILSDFGKIIVNDINDNSINFTISPNNNNLGDIINISATKQNNYNSTIKTDLLCLTWEEINPIDAEHVTILFSKAGTYLVLVDDSSPYLGYWKWEDESETKFLISWYKNMWLQASYAEITELTKDVLKYKYDDSIVIHEMKPVVNL